MYENTECSTSRDIEAIQIPAGAKITIPAGTPGVITQSLGGSYTIATNFGLSRVAEKDGDALGLEKSESQPTASANGVKDGEVSEDDVSCDSRSEEHTSELQSHHDLVCRLLLEKKKK